MFVCDECLLSIPHIQISDELNKQPSNAQEHFAGIIEPQSALVLLGVIACCQQQQQLPAPKPLLRGEGREAVWGRPLPKVPSTAAALLERLKRGRQRFVTLCRHLVRFLQIYDLNRAGAPSAVLSVFKTRKRKKTSVAIYLLRMRKRRERLLTCFQHITISIFCSSGPTQSVGLTIS